MKALRALGVVFFLVAATLPAFAVQPDEILPDAVSEARARQLSAELRCLVCQNQSIDDSDAPLARDLRLLVRERIKAGDDDASILAFMVARYGEFVLLRPPFGISTALLWGLPFLALAAGAFLIFRRSGVNVKEGVPPLSPEEAAELQRALDRRTPGGA